jgi:tubulin polyglutamylase TTLL4
MGVNFNDVFDKIKDVIIKTLIAVESHIVTNMKQTRHRNACFELYGFDIILDETLKPWLLEVNVCPSLSSSSPLDKHIKTMLLSDVLHIIGLQIYDRKKHEKEQEKSNKMRLLGFDPKAAKEDKTASPATTSIPSHSSPLKSSHGSPERNRKVMEFFDSLSDEDYDLIADLEEEHSRRGHFKRIFPLQQNVETYSKYFETQRHANTVIWNYLKLGSPINVVKHHFK